MHPAVDDSNHPRIDRLTGTRIDDAVRTMLRHRMTPRRACEPGRIGTCASRLQLH